MKGIELPINITVIIVIVVIVLLGIMALFNTGWGSGSSILSTESVKNSYCQIFDAQECDDASQIKTPDIDSDKNGIVDGNDDFEDFCINYYNGMTCQQVCKC